MGKRKKRRKEGEKERGEKRGEGERREEEEWGEEDKMPNNPTSWKGLSGTSVFYVWMKTNGSC